MRRFLFVLFLSLITIPLFSQERDVTRFLDISIEGGKKEMIKKIKSKGFKMTKLIHDKVLTGRFNGLDVYVDVVTNDRDEVWRVLVMTKDAYGERTIRSLFNDLCDQFKNSPKYITDRDWCISNDEDIKYGLKYGKKDYIAVFVQKPTELGDSIVHNIVESRCALKVINGDYRDLSEEEVKNDVEKEYLEVYNSFCSQKKVWFMINERDDDKYSIMFFYDNSYNQSKGEDL